MYKPQNYIWKFVCFGLIMTFNDILFGTAVAVAFLVIGSFAGTSLFIMFI